LDYFRGTSRFVGIRVCQRLRYWRIHSPAFGNRRGGVVDSVDSRAKFDLSDHFAKFRLTLSDYDSMSYLGHLVKDEQSKPTVAGVVSLSAALSAAELSYKHGY
jgi:hypothetical protein